MTNFPKYIFIIFFTYFSIIPSKSDTLNNAKKPQSLSHIVKKVLPSVVSIFAQKKVNDNSFSLLNDPFFQFFFDSRSEMPKERLSNSLGSGVIVHNSGYVITCHHVVNDADNIKIITNNKEQFDAVIVLSDPADDLCLLKIKTNKEKNFPFIEFSNNKNDEIGDRVIACGNPFGINMTVTSGIISAKNTIIQGRLAIQTDASLNPGNSGGALINVDGKMVGVPNAIFSKSGGSHGINFAVPATLGKKLLNSALSGKNLIHPWHGINVVSLNPEMIESLDANANGGVLVRFIHKKSPALSAGIEAGDIIIAINDQNIFNKETFRYILKSNEINEEIKLTILKKNKIIEKSFKMIEPPEGKNPMKKTIVDFSFLSGIEIANLSPRVASEIGFNDSIDYEGIVVTKVDEKYRESDFVFNIGDIIISINGKKVKNVNDVLQLVSGKEKLTSVILQRGHQKIQFENR